MHPYKKQEQLLLLVFRVRTNSYGLVLGYNRMFTKSSKRVHFFKRVLYHIITCKIILEIDGDDKYHHDPYVCVRSRTFDCGEDFFSAVRSAMVVLSLAKSYSIYLAILIFICPLAYAYSNK